MAAERRVKSEDAVEFLAGRRRAVLLGGAAVILHGLSRATKDFDVWLDPLPEPQEWSKPIFDLTNHFQFPRVVAVLPRSRNFMNDKVPTQVWRFPSPGVSVELLRKCGLSHRQNGGWVFQGIVMDDMASRLGGPEACVRLALDILKDSGRFFVSTSPVVLLVFELPKGPTAVITGLDVETVKVFFGAVVKDAGFAWNECDGLFYVCRK